MNRITAVGAAAALVGLLSGLPAAAATPGSQPTATAAATTRQHSDSGGSTAFRLQQRDNQLAAKDSAERAAASTAANRALGDRGAARTGPRAKPGTASPAITATGSITGTVTAAAGGTPVEGICANASTLQGFWVGNAATAADGTYTITGLATGEYIVSFDSMGFCPGGVAGNWASQWWNNQPTMNTANPVAVTDGQATGSIDAVLQPGGSISGMVTAAGGGALEGICVTATLPGGMGLSNVGTAADGTYVLRGLAAGDYLVNFTSSGYCPGGIASNYAGQWWNGQPSIASANPVTVTAGQTTGSIDAVLQPGASISGTVTAAGGGALEGICVSAGTPDGYWMGNVGTAADGTYTITGLAAGDYVIGFDSSGNCPGGVAGNWARQWWNNQSTQFMANPVSVSAGQTTGSIDAVMQPGGTLSGTVTAAGGGPLSGICVNVNLPDGYGVSNTATSADGSYTVTGLAAGEYVVNFDSSGFCPGGVPSSYVSQWWNNQPDQGTANIVTVAAGQTTGSIDAVMQPGGSISGTVTAAGGGALSGICASAFDVASGQWMSGTNTAPDGSYTIAGLAAGDYNVQFSTGCGNSGNWAAQWWNDQPTQNRANSIAVAVGQTTGSIDAILQPGGSISGTVTAATGGPVEGICVILQTPGGDWMGTAATGPDGTYMISGVVAGDYVVDFDSSGFCGGGSPSNFVGQWYDNQPTQVTATTVPVVAGQTTGSIDAVLQPGGSISGTVTAAGGGPLGGICVFVNLPDGFGVTGVSTSPDGTYTASGLPAGDYLVSFDNSGYCMGGSPGNYIGQWYDNQPSMATANIVPVVVGQTTGPIDAALQEGGSISGTVTAASGGSPQGGICVNVFALAGEQVNGAATWTDGTYVVGGLLPGDYHVSFTLACGNPGSYAEQWYNGKPAEATADTVSVTAGHTSGSIDAALWTKPGAPTIVSGTPGNTTVQLTWSAPTDDGGSMVSAYVVTPYIGAAPQTPQTFTSTATTQTITGLANGTAYTFTVAATNLAGTGPDSAHSTSFTPRTVPAAPNAPAASTTKKANTVSLTWTDNGNGGAAITNHQVQAYLYTPAKGKKPATYTAVGTPVVTGSSSTSYSMTVSGKGLYVFAVAAGNAAGFGSFSPYSNSVKM